MKVKRLILLSIIILFLGFLVVENLFAEEITGNVIEIENTKVTVQSNTEEITIIVSNPDGIKVGDYVAIVYQPLADLFVAEEIQILQNQ